MELSDRSSDGAVSRLARWFSGPIRAHIQTLRAAGIGVDQIAKLSALSSSHVRGLIYPSSTGKPPFQKVRRETAERILAVAVDDSFCAANSHVDSMTSDTVTARTAQLVNAMYERLWDSPPPQHTTAQRKASDAARALAAHQQGWLPPLAWDDVDDDPEPDPNQPDTSSNDDLDEIAIERAIDGDARRATRSSPPGRDAVTTG